MPWTTDEFLSRVKVICALPALNGKISDAEILDLALFEALDEVLPALRATRESYKVKTYDVAITADQASYRLPSRATAATTRHVLHVSTGGAETPIDEIAAEDAYRWDAWPFGAFAFYFEGDALVLRPTPTQTIGTLRVKYYLRPSKLVTAAECGLITGISSAVLTCSGGIPGAWTTSESYDIVEGAPQADVLALDLTATDVDTGTDEVTFASADDFAGAAVGDYIALAGETPMVPLPDALHGPFAHYTAASVLRAISDKPAAAEAKEAAAEKLGKVLTLLEPRNTGGTKRAVNWSSPLRYMKARRRR